MDKKISSKIPYILIVVLGIAIAGMLFYILPYRYRLSQTITFEESQEPLKNPLTGFAPPAENMEECEGNRLVYIGLTWADWEPRPGVYDIEGLEERFHLEKWKEENKHAVLRFLCDIPGDETHMDIPEWLYAKTRDGAYYDTEYGQGYAPDYGNSYFLERHGEALKALADYCNEDYFVSYVELGSLGHWGEWHTNTEEGVPGLPGADVCWEYVLDYSDNFHNARLLMRRNYVMAAEGGLGVYNDMTGHKADTEEWLGWLKEGGSFETRGEALELVPIENFWEKAPVGGEFTSEYTMEEMLDGRLSETLELLERSHMTFLGPKCPDRELLESSGAEAVEERLGYRFYISELRTQYVFGANELKVHMKWNNTGLAPLYWDWPVTMYVYDKDGNLQYWEGLDISLSKLMPGGEIETDAKIPFTDLFRKGYQIGIGITDPQEKESLKLAMESEEKEGVQIIYTYQNE